MPRPYASGVVAAPADAVWKIVREFNSLPDWLPPITASEIIEGENNVVGAVRKLTLGDQGTVSERLLTVDDVERSYTYEFTDSGPFPVRSYRSTIRVAPITATGESFVEWWAWFDSDAEHEAELITTYADGVYAAGIANLPKVLG